MAFPWQHVTRLRQLVLVLAGPESTHCTLRIHNDEQRSPVHLGQAFGHFSCSHPGLRIAKLIEDMQLTGRSHNMDAQ